MKNLIKDLLPPVALRTARQLRKMMNLSGNAAPTSLQKGNAPASEAPKEQSLDIYWTPEMAALLETWGIGTTWHELNYLMYPLTGKVLDIACGTGKNMQDLQCFPGIELYGCDISDLLIDKAIARGINRENLFVCDATKTGFHDNQFDYSYSIGSYEHFTEEGLLAVIAETHRVTRQTSFHQVPVSRSGVDEGWISPYQSYFNNSTEWWLQKFRSSYRSVIHLDSLWNDSRSVGKWFICSK